MTHPLDSRVAELLSASLDGAVTPEERQLADQWLAASAVARGELAGLAAVRDAVRALPPVEPPAGFFDAVLAHGPAAGSVVVPLAGRRRRPVAVVASAVASAAAWIVVAGDPSAAIRPPIEGVAAVAVGTSAVETSDEEPSVERLGRLELVRAVSSSDADDATAVLGDRSGAEVAVLRQEGRVAWTELPRGARDTRAGALTWVDLTAGPDLARVIVVRDGAVYTLASDDLDAPTLVELAASLPPGDGVEGRGPWDRVRRACDSLVDALG